MSYTYKELLTVLSNLTSEQLLMPASVLTAEGVMEIEPITSIADILNTDITDVCEVNRPVLRLHTGNLYNDMAQKTVRLKF